MGLFSVESSRVFLVDDDREFLFEMAEGLREQGFLVEKQVNPHKAFARILKWNPDVVILDMDMPEWTGLELLHSLRSTSIGSDLPIVLLTGHGSQVILESGFQKGLDDYLTKPVSLTELTLRLTALLKRSQNRKRNFPIPLREARLQITQPITKGLLLWIPGHQVVYQSNLKSYQDLLNRLIIKISHKIRDVLTVGEAYSCDVFWLTKDVVFFSNPFAMEMLDQRALLRTVSVYERFWISLLKRRGNDDMLLASKRGIVKESLPHFYIRGLRADKFNDIISLAHDVELALSLDEKQKNLLLIEL